MLKFSQDLKTWSASKFKRYFGLTKGTFTLTETDTNTKTKTDELATVFSDMGVSVQASFIDLGIGLGLC